MKKWQVILLLVVVAAVAAGAGAYAATNYGTQSDPLVTVSYLTDTLEPSIKSDFDGRLPLPWSNWKLLSKRIWPVRQARSRSSR
jgi:hypothetical protein